MSGTSPLPPPPAPAGGPTRQRLHPLAIASLVLSVLGFFPLLIVGGLIGAPLGAIAGGSIRRQPQRFRGAGLADTGLGVGLVSGVLVLATFGVVKADDWGWVPFTATVAYGALVIGLAVLSRTSRGKAGSMVALGAVGIVAAVIGIIGLVVVLALLFRLIAEGFVDALTGGD